MEGLRPSLRVLRSKREAKPPADAAGADAARAKRTGKRTFMGIGSGRGLRKRGSKRRCGTGGESCQPVACGAGARTSC